jgi:hypothetical protein
VQRYVISRSQTVVFLGRCCRPRQAAACVRCTPRCILVFTVIFLSHCPRPGDPCVPGKPALDVRKPSALPCWQLATLMRCMPGLSAATGRRPASPHGRSMRCASGQPALDDRRPSAQPCWPLAASMCCMPRLPAPNGRRPASQHGGSMRCAPGQPTLDGLAASACDCKWVGTSLSISS